ncbi:hypothetical protein [Vibrio alginolyticus]|uniref:hypothetical protein n=1 Tax=Vibrio alginolyticus TaxID=663 RepID=UPI003748445D
MRSRTQLVIDALEAEYKRLEKKAARYRAQQEMPLLAFFEPRKEIQEKLPTLDAGTRAFFNYVHQAMHHYANFIHKAPSLTSFIEACRLFELKPYQKDSIERFEVNRNVKGGLICLG